jgi:hypothetical protein
MPKPSAEADERQLSCLREEKPLMMAWRRHRRSSSTCRAAFAPSWIIGSALVLSFCFREARGPASSCFRHSSLKEFHGEDLAAIVLDPLRRPDDLLPGECQAGESVLLVDALGPALFVCFHQPRIA